MKRRGTVVLSVIMALSLLCSVFGFTLAYAADEPENFATSQANWKDTSVGYTTTSFDENGMKMTAMDTAMAFSKKVSANSTMKFEFVGNTPQTTWGNMYVLFKSEDNVSPDAPKKIVQDNETSSTGNWLGFVFGASWTTQFVESENGVVTKTSRDGIISGFDTWYVYKQTTALEIKTTDTETGVDVEVKYLASGWSDNTGETKTLTYTSDNVALKGDFSVSVGYFGEVKDGGNITLKTFNATLAAEQQPEVTLENLATSSAFWKGGVNPACFQFGTSGVGFFDTQGAAMISNQTIPAASTIAIDMTGTLSQGQYGNFYFVFKNESKSYTFVENIKPVEQGNYLALQIGGDGCFMYDCKDGAVTKTEIKDKANGGPVADNTSVWWWYKQDTKIWITTADTDTGVHAEIKFVGPSGQMTTFGYDSTNEKIKGDSFMSFGMFTSDAGTPDKFVNINSLTVTGIEEGEGFIPDLDIPALNLKANNAATETVTTANVEQVKAVLAELKSAQADMNYPQSREFQSNLIAQIEAKIAAYEQGMAAAKTAEELLKALPASVNAENYAAAKSAIIAARATYDALSEDARALITSYAKLTAAESALAAYEKELSEKEAAQAVNAQIDALPAEITAENYDSAKTAIEAARTAYDALTDAQKQQVTSSSKLTAAESALKTYEDSLNSKGGCSNTVAYSALGVSLALVLAAGVIAFARKKKD